MGKFTRLLFLSLFLLLPLLSRAGDPIATFKGKYLIYSDYHHYIFGAGKIEVKIGEKKIFGDYLFFNVKTLKGKVLGRASMDSKSTFDEILFSLIPLNFKSISFGEKIKSSGKAEEIKLKTLKELKNSALFYETRELRIYKSRKIIGYYVIPYVMGVPSFPVKKLILKKSEFFEKTTFYLKNINYDGFYGFSITPSLAIRTKALSGDINFKLFERELFNISGEKRGINISANQLFKVKGRKILEMNGFFSSDSKSSNLSFSHESSIGPISFSLNQTISKTSSDKAVYLLDTLLKINGLKILSPSLNLKYDYRKSYSYLISTPLNILKNIDIFLSYLREKTNNSFISDTSKFSSSINFSSSILSGSSSFNLTKDMIEDSVKKDFALNLSPPQISLINNINIMISPFYSFSSYPLSDQIFKKNNFGLNFSINSSGVLLPFKFSLYPNFSVYQLWEKDRESKTNFNYFLNIEKRKGVFSLIINYGISSSYKTKAFWIEGNNLKNMNIRAGLKKMGEYDFYLNFYFDNNYSLENITSKLEVNFLRDWRLSSYSIYYNKTKKLTSFEIFLEKTIKNSFKIQGGYSLLLKRFFIKLIPY